jgi:hypothetical protein
MILHECGHYVAGAKHYAGEWPPPQGSPDWPDGKKNPDGSNKPQHPRNYMQLLPGEAARNACTYASFAAHCALGSDERPGAGRLYL